jgi:hypothetical protein
MPRAALNLLRLLRPAGTLERYHPSGCRSRQSAAAHATQTQPVRTQGGDPPTRKSFSRTRTYPLGSPRRIFWPPSLPGRPGLPHLDSALSGAHVAGRFWARTSRGSTWIAGWVWRPEKGPEMGLTRAEQETVIRWDEADQEVRIWSASPKTWQRMARLGVAPCRETTTGAATRLPGCRTRSDGTATA